MFIGGHFTWHLMMMELNVGSNQAGRPNFYDTNVRFFTAQINSNMVLELT